MSNLEKVIWGLVLIALGVVATIAFDGDATASVLMWMFGIGAIVDVVKEGLEDGKF